MAGVRKGFGPRLKLMSCEYVPVSATPFAVPVDRADGSCAIDAEHRHARVDFTLRESRAITVSGDRVALIRN